MISPSIVVDIAEHPVEPGWHILYGSSFIDSLLDGDTIIVMSSAISLNGYNGWHDDDNDGCDAGDDDVYCNQFAI